MTLAVLLGVLIAAFLAFLTTRPDSFTVKRSLLIRAKPADIFPLINDFHPQGWGRWSPWEKIDPELKRAYSGPATGVGSVYEWEGNNKVGSGRMEIQHADSPSQVDIRLDFLKPFKNTSAATFQLIDEGDQTMVTWKMSGAVPFVGKIMHLFMDMDSMIGKQFEEGLNNLKALAEKK